MFDTEQLNEIASLLHIVSEVHTNHSKLGGIVRAAQRRLDEINLELVEAESKEIDAKKKADADRQAKAYVPPKEGDANYVAAEKPAPKTEAIYGSNVEVERRV